MFALMSKKEGFSFGALNSVRKNFFFINACTKFRYKCYYSVLGLNSGASPSDIKAAYYKLSMEFHPDRNSGSDDASIKFREITEAYEVLGNVDKKQKYDAESVRAQYERSYEGFSNYRAGQRTYTYREPRMGKSWEYNYDEHFRQHYEEVFKRHQEHLNRMRMANEKWGGQQFSNPYARRARSDSWAKRDSYSRPKVFLIPFNFVFLFFFMFTISFIIQLMDGDIPAPPDFSDMPKKPE